MKDKNLNYDEIFEAIMEMELNETQYDNIEEDLTDLEKKQIKKNLYRKIGNRGNSKRIIKVASVAVLISMSGVFFSKPAFAEKIPIFSEIYETLGYYKEYKDYTEFIGESKKDNGYTVTIEQLMGTPKTIIYGVKVTSDKKLPEDFEVMPVLSGSYAPKYGTGSSKSEQIDEYTKYFYGEITTKDIFPKRDKLDLNFEYIDDKDYFNIGFKDIKVDFSSSFEKSRTIKLNKNIEFDGHKLKIKEIYTSPINTKLILSDLNIGGRNNIGGYNIVLDVDGTVYESYEMNNQGLPSFTFCLKEDDISEAKVVKIKLYKAKALDVASYGSKEYTKYYSDHSVLTDEEVVAKNIYNEEDGVKYPSEFYCNDGIVTHITKVEREGDKLKVYYNSNSHQLQRGFKIKAGVDDKEIIGVNEIIYKNKKGEGYVKEFDISKHRNGKIDIYVNYVNGENPSLYKESNEIQIIQN